MTVLDADLVHKYICVQDGWLASIIHRGTVLYDVETEAGLGISLSNELRDGTLYLPFTSGSCTRIKERIGLVEKGTLLDKINPSFAYGFKEKQDIRIGLTYPDIIIRGSEDVRTGTYRLVIRNNGTDAEGNVIISLRFLR
jgi:hypothetical protein